MSFIKIPESRGFSLTEVMVTLVIAAILLGIVSASFPQLKRVSDRFLNQAFFEEQYLIFLLRFEDEYRQAASMNPDAAAEIGQLTFELDENMDGDLEDAGERIAYRWNKKKQRIDRKSGSGYFQALLEGVTAFSWREVSPNPVCHEMAIQSGFSVRPRVVRYCMDPLP